MKLASISVIFATLIVVTASALYINSVYAANQADVKLKKTKGQQERDYVIEYFGSQVCSSFIEMMPPSTPDEIKQKAQESLNVIRDNNFTGADLTKANDNCGQSTIESLQFEARTGVVSDYDKKRLTGLEKVK